MEPKVPNKLASIFVNGALSLVLVSVFYGEDFIQRIFYAEEPRNIHSNDSKAPADPSKKASGARLGISSDSASIPQGDSNSPQGESLPAPNHESKPSTQPSLAIVASTRLLVLVTGLATIIGATLQGGGHLLRILLQRWVTCRRFCSVLGNARAHEELTSWLAQYIKLKGATRKDMSKEFRRSGLLFDFEPKDERHQYRNSVHPILPKSAVGIFFRFANGGHLSWVLQHYATYYLTTDTLVSFWLIGSTAPLLSPHIGNIPFVPVLLVRAELFQINPWIWLGVAAAASYLLLVVSVHRYLYTYNAVIRHCCILLTRGSEAFPDKANDAK